VAIYTYDFGGGRASWKPTWLLAVLLTWAFLGRQNWPFTSMRPEKSQQLVGIEELPLVGNLVPLVKYGS
jgi:hypothetical protein